MKRKIIRGMYNNEWTELTDILIKGITDMSLHVRNLSTSVLLVGIGTPWRRWFLPLLTSRHESGGACHGSDSWHLDPRRAPAAMLFFQSNSEEQSRQREWI
jgi:hypothetical protein